MGKKADRRRIDGESRAEVDLNILQFLYGGANATMYCIIFGKISQLGSGISCHKPTGSTIKSGLAPNVLG